MQPLFPNLLLYPKLNQYLSGLVSKNSLPRQPDVWSRLQDLKPFLSEPDTTKLSFYHRTIFERVRGLEDNPSVEEAEEGLALLKVSDLDGLIAECLAKDGWEEWGCYLALLNSIVTGKVLVEREKIFAVVEKLPFEFKVRMGHLVDRLSGSHLVEACVGYEKKELLPMLIEGAAVECLESFQPLLAVCRNALKERSFVKLCHAYEDKQWPYAEEIINYATQMLPRMEVDAAVERLLPRLAFQVKELTGTFPHREFFIEWNGRGWRFDKHIPKEERHSWLCDLYKNVFVKEGNWDKAIVALEKICKVESDSPLVVDFIRKAPLEKLVLFSAFTRVHAGELLERAGKAFPKHLGLIERALLLDFQCSEETGRYLSLFGKPSAALVQAVGALGDPEKLILLKAGAFSFNEEECVRLVLLIPDRSEALDYLEKGTRHTHREVYMRFLEEPFDASVYVRCVKALSCPSERGPVLKRAVEQLVEAGEFEAIYPLIFDFKSLNVSLHAFLSWLVEHKEVGQIKKIKASFGSKELPLLIDPALEKGKRDWISALVRLNVPFTDMQKRAVGRMLEESGKESETLVKVAICSPHVRLGEAERLKDNAMELVAGLEFEEAFASRVQAVLLKKAEGAAYFLRIQKWLAGLSVEQQEVIFVKSFARAVAARSFTFDDNYRALYRHLLAIQSDKLSRDVEVPLLEKLIQKDNMRDGTLVAMSHFNCMEETLKERFFYALLALLGSEEVSTKVKVYIEKQIVKTDLMEINPFELIQVAGTKPVIQKALDLFFEQVEDYTETDLQEAARSFLLMVREAIEDSTPEKIAISWHILGHPKAPFLFTERLRMRLAGNLIFETMKNQLQILDAIAEDRADCMTKAIEYGLVHGFDSEDADVNEVAVALLCILSEGHSKDARDFVFQVWSLFFKYVPNVSHPENLVKNLWTYTFASFGEEHLDQCCDFYEQTKKRVIGAALTEEMKRAYLVMACLSIYLYEDYDDFWDAFEITELMAILHLNSLKLPPSVQEQVDRMIDEYFE